MNRLVPLAGLVCLLGACGAEGMHDESGCQCQAWNSVWEQNDFHLDVVSPANRDCPLALSNFGQPVYFSADVSAPRNVSTLLTWRAYDALNTETGNYGSVPFLPGIGGRDRAQPQGHYFAGLARDVAALLATLEPVERRRAERNRVHVHANERDTNRVEGGGEVRLPSAIQDRDLASVRRPLTVRQPYPLTAGGGAG